MVFKKSLIVAFVTLVLDFLFHFFLTRPMESLTYFVIKFLLAFFVAAALFSWSSSLRNTYPLRTAFIAGLIFSSLMSMYYRAWELGEAYVPFGSRAPDILGISRTSIWFSIIWWLGHTAFFAVGVVAANKILAAKGKK